MQVVLTGQGSHFCAGIDLELVGQHSRPDTSGCPGRKAEKLRRQILNMQVPWGLAGLLAMLTVQFSADALHAELAHLPGVVSVACSRCSPW